ncbi:MAG: hypothetical protein H7099_20245 [Gemmatimonadaceae bacterium]|nr:hypothetical protein [Gemmatimonadaceae bacterium]
MNTFVQFLQNLSDASRMLSIDFAATRAQRLGELDAAIGRAAGVAVDMHEKGKWLDLIDFALANLPEETKYERIIHSIVIETKAHTRNEVAAIWIVGQAESGGRLSVGEELYALASMTRRRGVQLDRMKCHEFWFHAGTWTKASVFLPSPWLRREVMNATHLAIAHAATAPPPPAPPAPGAIPPQYDI